jgi:hypothetical protein
MAYFYSLAAYFAWHLRGSQHWRDALLSGLMLGLAAWTKNAALVGLPLLLLWLLWIRLPLRLTALAMTAVAAVAAPWYLRNLLEAGLIIPPTAWTEQSQHTVEALLVFISRPQNYALTGPLILLSVVTAIITLIRRRLDSPALVLLLLWTLPFFGVWWLFASYDPRFVLMFLPLLCVLAGIQVAGFWARISAQWQRRMLAPALIAALLLTALMTWDSVEYKGDILRQPLMSADERRAIVYADRQPRLYRELYGED